MQRHQILADSIICMHGYTILIYLQIEPGLLNKSSCLATALRVTKFITTIDMNWVKLCCAA